MRLAICGNGQHGKDTVAEWFRDHSTLRYFCSTSEAAAPIVFQRWGIAHYGSVEACYRDRRNHRLRWAQTIWEYNQPDGLTLYRDMIVSQDVLTGIRKLEELQACYEHGIVELTLWVEQPGQPPEGSSNLITAADCDITLLNEHGRLEDTHRKLYRLATSWGVRK